MGDYPSGTDCKESSNEMAQITDCAVPNGIDPAVQWVEEATLRSPRDHLAVEAGEAELGEVDHSFLLPGDRSYARIATTHPFDDRSCIDETPWLHTRLIA